MQRSALLVALSVALTAGLPSARSSAQVLRATPPPVPLQSGIPVSIAGPSIAEGTVAVWQPTEGAPIRIAFRDLQLVVGETTLATLPEALREATVVVHAGSGSKLLVWAEGGEQRLVFEVHGERRPRLGRSWRGPVRRPPPRWARPSTSVEPTPPLTFTSVVAGPAMTCGIASDGTVRCWGWNQGGGVQRPVGAPGAVQLALTVSGACALTVEGTVACWGGSRSGEHGNGQISTQRSEAERVRGLSDIVEITAATTFACARARDGRVYCWGSNGSGQLGDGTRENRMDPVLVQGLPPAVRVQAGAHHACAIATDGALYCWGRNDYAQIADRPERELTRATQALPGPLNDVAVGHLATCGLLRDGTVMCRGERTWEAGSPKPIDRTPVVLPGVTRAVSLSAGVDYGCALVRGGRVQCWGSNSFGQLGRGRVTTPSPAPVARLTNVDQLSTSEAHACARERTGALFCWGRNAYGELGDASQEHAFEPVPVLGTAR